ncbi:probable helicase with zinc finger domain isoform X2 [Limulus polyphemus]|uniref:Probable helicase with zinc finger domain isoform X2 n=1 Tax=Limulus polyphemus TaxID=6850 RepID=A0ABM1S7Y6_LIMPO|nr:probable helicase with zinc finger domain isoform X2 [Limulus polyphemus]
MECVSKTQAERSLSKAQTESCLIEAIIGNDFTEVKADTLLKQGCSSVALSIYSHLINQLSVSCFEKRTRLLLKRCACALKMKEFKMVLQDCEEILMLKDGKDQEAWQLSIAALCRLGQLKAAERRAKDWLVREPQNEEAMKTFSKLKIVQETLGEEEEEEDEGFSPTNSNMLDNEKMVGERRPPDGMEQEEHDGKLQCSVQEADLFCSYCNVGFTTDAELEFHCRSQEHQITIMSDKGRDWKFRTPPRGISAASYSLCEIHQAGGQCRLGAQCCDAHGEEELAEWKERYNYRQMKMQKAKDCNLHGSLYSEQLLEKWFNATNPDLVMTENLAGVNVEVKPNLDMMVTSKDAHSSWKFDVTCKEILYRVALLYDNHRSHFSLAEVTVASVDSHFLRNYSLENDCQEWSNPDDLHLFSDSLMVYTIKVHFETHIFGTFRQSVVFDFRREPVLFQQLCVDAVPVDQVEALEQVKQTVLCSTPRWDNTNTILVPFSLDQDMFSEDERGLLNLYPPPHTTKFVVTQSIMEPALTQNNYKNRMHDLLFIEELAQCEVISRFNITAQMKLTSCYLLTPAAATTAKYVRNDELYACLNLISELCSDSASGRLILNNCQTVLVAPNLETENNTRQKVYESIIEDKGKNSVYLRLSKHCVEELNLQPDTDFLAEVQFQINRLPLCELHYAVDKLNPVHLIFPDLSLNLQIPWSPKKQWKRSAKLNPKQKEAVVAITTPIDIRLPPILITGPFGTGKTYTLVQAIKEILNQSNTRVLVCTHSNSAADIYIREYLHPYVEMGHTEARPLRVYYRHRWIATVHPVVLEYCLLTMDCKAQKFVMPSIEDIMKHRVVVTTVGTCRYLVHLGLDKGFFTHILIDEAAQAIECAAITPLALADEQTRIVLAGDHMQLNPEVYSKFAEERNLQWSLLERLFDFYPSSCPCKIFLCENYRSHSAIIDYTSELFYNKKLVASGQPSAHPAFFPLTFFTARGEDSQDINCTSFYNNAEVYEVVARVSELQKTWPKEWGERTENGIGIVSPYYDQVIRIRSELRKRKMHGISVENVLNVQGKEFQVIFLSTVRTRNTCTNLLSGPDSNSTKEEMDYGFLSNPKLLNTAITRARSLVAVVGDPISLCSVGNCRKLWEKFIFCCHQNNSLYGITWKTVEAHLDGVELKKIYGLNPLAPEFIPRFFNHANPYISPTLNPFPSPWNLHMNHPPSLCFPALYTIPSVYPYLFSPCMYPFTAPPVWPTSGPFQGPRYQPHLYRQTMLPPAFPQNLSSLLSQRNSVYHSEDAKVIELLHKQAFGHDLESNVTMKSSNPHFNNLQRVATNQVAIRGSSPSQEASQKHELIRKDHSRVQILPRVHLPHKEIQSFSNCGRVLQHKNNSLSSTNSIMSSYPVHHNSFVKEGLAVNHESTEFSTKQDLNCRNLTKEPSYSNVKQFNSEFSTKQKSVPRLGDSSHSRINLLLLEDFEKNKVSLPTSDTTLLQVPSKKPDSLPKAIIVQELEAMLFEASEKGQSFQFTSNIGQETNQLATGQVQSFSNEKMKLLNSFSTLELEENSENRPLYMRGPLKIRDQLSERRNTYPELAIQKNEISNNYRQHTIVHSTFEQQLYNTLSITSGHLSSSYPELTKYDLKQQTMIRDLPPKPIHNSLSEQLQTVPGNIHEELQPSQFRLSGRGHPALDNLSQQLQPITVYKPGGLQSKLHSFTTPVSLTQRLQPTSNILSQQFEPTPEHFSTGLELTSGCIPKQLQSAQIQYAPGSCLTKRLTPTLVSVPGDLQLTLDSTQDSVHSRLQAPQDNVHSRLQAPRDSVHSRLQAPRDSVHSRLQAPRDNIYSRLQAPRDNIHSRLQAPHDNMHSRLQAPQNSVHSRLQDSVHSRILASHDNLNIRLQAPHDNLNIRLQAPQDSVHIRLQTPQDSVHSRLQAQQDSVHSRLQASHDSTHSTLQAPHDSIYNRFQVPQDNLHGRLHAPQDIVHSRQGPLNNLHRTMQPPQDRMYENVQTSSKNNSLGKLQESQNNVPGRMQAQQNSTHGRLLVPQNNSVGRQQAPQYSVLGGVQDLQESVYGGLQAPKDNIHGRPYNPQDCRNGRLQLLHKSVDDYEHVPQERLQTCVNRNFEPNSSRKWQNDSDCSSGQLQFVQKSLNLNTNAEANNSLELLAVQKVNSIVAEGCASDNQLMANKTLFQDQHSPPAYPLTYAGAVRSHFPQDSSLGTLELDKPPVVKRNIGSHEDQDLCIKTSLKNQSKCGLYKYFS